jgi:hypothetical protein
LKVDIYDSPGKKTSCVYARDVYTYRETNAKMEALWTRLYNSAVESGYANPKNFADTACKYRAHVLKLRAERPKIQVIDKPPKPNETCVDDSNKRGGRKVIHPMYRCKATTLEGKQCPFRASSGCFCSKHREPVRDEPVK